MLTQQGKHNLKTKFVHSTHASPRYQSEIFPQVGTKKTFNRNGSNTTQGPWCIGPRGMPNETYFKMKACKFNRNTDHIHNMISQFLFHIFELKSISNMRMSVSTTKLPVIYRSQQIFLPSILPRWCFSCLKKASLKATWNTHPSADASKTVVVTTLQGTRGSVPVLSQAKAMSSKDLRRNGSQTLHQQDWNNQNHIY